MAYISEAAQLAADGFFQVDLIVPHEIKGIGLEGRYTSAEFLKECYIYTSNDGHSWTKLSYVSGVLNTLYHLA